MTRPAFTALEFLLVIAILAALGGLSMPLYREYQIRSDLNIAAEQIAQGLGRARLRSMAGEQGAVWGYHVPAGILYRGTEYVSRDPQFDERYPMPPTIVATGLLQVSYAKLTGRPSATGTIILTAISGDQRTLSIEINSEGIPVSVGDYLTICHCPSHKTMKLNDNAWKAHEKHGDHLGACTFVVNECK